MECGGTLGRCSTGPVPPSPVAPIPAPPAAAFMFGTVFAPGGLVTGSMQSGGELLPPDDDDDDDPLEIHDL